MIQLKWEPSWNLYSKRTYSPEAPGAFQEDQYFYYQELRNRYDRHWTSLHEDVEERFFLADLSSGSNSEMYGVTVPVAYYDDDGEYTGEGFDYKPPVLDFMVDGQTWYYRNDVVFEHRRVSSNGDDDALAVRSTYYDYSVRWDWEALGPEYTVGDEPVPCPGTGGSGGSGGGGGPVGGSAGDLDELSPLRNVAYVPPPEGQGPGMGITPLPGLNATNWTLAMAEIPPGCRVVKSASGSFGWMRNIDWRDSIGLVTIAIAEDTVLAYDEHGFVKRPPMSDLVRGVFLLRAIHEQADEIHQEDHAEAAPFSEPLPLTDFHKVPAVAPFEQEEWVPVFPFRTIRKQYIHNYNWQYLPTLMENERGMKTAFEFPGLTIHGYQVQNEFGCTYETFQEIYAPGLPKSITIALGTPEEQVTSFEYTDDNLLERITDPNLLTLDFEYDVYGRLFRKLQNEEELVRNIYHSWTNTPSSPPFDHVTRTAQNWTESRQRIDDQGYEGILTRSYVDPNGRQVAVMSAPITDILDPQPQSSNMLLLGLQRFDTWDRPVESFKQRQVANGTGANAFALNANLLNTTGLAHSSSLYENDHRSRPLRSSAPGEDILTGYTKKVRYQFINGPALACELSLSPVEAAMIMPDALMDHVFARTETEDEDGNIARVYVNALGQQIATAGVINSGQQAVTLFDYDDQGNLARVIDPSKRHTTYEHNLLGWLFRKTTADGGVTKYMYDVSGNVVLEQDMVGAAGEEDPNISEYVWNQTTGQWVEAPGQVKRPTYRRVVYDLLSRPQRQERVRAIHPLGALPNAPTCLNFPVDPMVYGTVQRPTSFPVAEFDLVNGANWPNPYYTHVFSTASTIDEFNRSHVMMQGLDQSGNWSYFREWKGPETILVDPILEKTWHYAHAPISPTLAPLLFPDVPDQLSSLRTFLLGKLSHTVTYPHYSYAELPTTPHTLSNGYLYTTTWTFTGADQHPVHLDFLSYNDQGLPAWQLQQFNPTGITTDEKGLIVRLDYPTYDLLGNLHTVNVDVNHDMVLDMQQHYTYDERARLHEVYLNLSNILRDGELVARHHYDEDRNVLDHVEYFRGDCASDLPILVDNVLFTHDLRDRLTGIQGDHYTEVLHYDASLPSHPVVGSLQGDQHYNGAINGLEHYSDLSDLEGYAPDVLDLPTKVAFRYDGLGRMSRADAVVGDATNGITAPTHPLFGLGDEQYTFTANGNIRNARRTGFDQDDELGTLDWTYLYGNGGNNRLAQVSAEANSSEADRFYVYDANGNLIGDAHRNVVNSHYGRAQLPMTLELWKNTSFFRADYHYGPSDQRIYKRYGKHLGKVEQQEFYLMDAGGRTLGVLDMLGGQDDGDGNTTGAWTWYAYGGQRLAKTTPAPDQQPDILTRDLARKANADVNEAIYQALITYIYDDPYKRSWAD